MLLFTCPSNHTIVRERFPRAVSLRSANVTDPEVTAWTILDRPAGEPLNPPVPSAKKAWREAAQVVARMKKRQRHDQQ